MSDATAGRRWWVAVVVLATGLTACSAEVPTGEPPAVASPPAPISPAEPPGPTTAVFLGDSYTVGLGGTGYVQDTAEELGWIVLPSGQSGTGYVAAGIEDWMSPYGDRVDVVVQARPDVVLVQGSTNDVGRPVADVRAAAQSLYRELSHRLPEAEIVVLGPTAPPVVDGTAVRAVRDALRAAAEDAGVRFVDPIAGGWLQPTEASYGDGLHPNDAGYLELVDRLAAELGGG